MRISWTEFVEQMQRHSCLHCSVLADYNLKQNKQEESPLRCIDACMDCFAIYIEDTVKRWEEIEKEKGV